MKRDFSRTLAVSTALIILASCSGNATAPEILEISATPESSQSVQTEPSDETAASAATAPAKTTTPRSSEASTTPKIEEKSDPSYGKNERTQAYIAALLECREFNTLADTTAQTQLIDMDGDGSPELIAAEFVQYPHAMLVFRVGDDGKAVFMPIAAGSFSDGRSDHISYMGGSLTPYRKNGETVFLTHSSFSDSLIRDDPTQTSACLEVSLRDGEVFSRAVYGTTSEKGIAERYWLENMENEVSDIEHSSAVYKYEAELEPLPLPTRKIWQCSNKNEWLKAVADALDSYFDAADKTYGCSSERREAYAAYLENYRAENEFPEAGVLIDDINGDGNDEMVVLHYPRNYSEEDIGPCTVLYYNSTGLHMLKLDIMSVWGHNHYNKETGQLINLHFYGHTEGTYGALDCYIYDWNGDDYVRSSYNRKWGYEHYDDEVGHIAYLGQGFINGEPVDDGVFLKKEDEIIAIDAQAGDFTFALNPAHSDFEPWQSACESSGVDYGEYLSEKLYY